MDYFNGSKVRLRPLEMQDLDLLYEWENNPAVWEVSHTVTPYSKFVLQQYLEQSHLDIYSTKQLRLVIVEVKTNTAVGLIDLFDFDPFHLRAGIGVLIAQKENRGRGLAKSAVELLVNYAKNHLKLNQLYCHVGVENQNSVELFSRVGFIACGLKKQWLNTANGYQDEWTMQLLFS